MQKKVGVKKSDKRKVWAEGFTFVETIAVLSVSAILAAGTSVSAAKLINLAKRTSAQNQIEGFSSALQTYFLDCGAFPTSEQGLSSLWEKPILYPVPENWNGPYLETRPKQDPWGFDYEYFNTKDSVVSAEVPKNIPFFLRSLGKDGVEGGSGDDEDILSWN